MTDWVWIFHGERATFSSAVFSARDSAESWISQYGLSGILTKMPVDQSVYDWTIAGGYFKPRTTDQESAAFIQKFTSSYLEHYHYINGLLNG